MEKVTVTYAGKTYKVERNVTAEHFMREHEIILDDPVACIISGHLTRLDKRIKADCTLDFILLRTPLGQRIYESSVLFLFIVAFKKLFPDGELTIQHAISNGLYAEAPKTKLNQTDVDRIERKMHEMVEKKLVIAKIRRDWDMALSDFRDRGRTDVVDMLKYYPPSVFKIYNLDGVEETLYLPLVVNTDSLKYFELKKYREGVVVVVPLFAKSKRLAAFKEQPKLFNTYKEYREWSKILKVRNVGQLNEHIMNGDIQDLIMISEGLHEKKIAYIADMITKQKKIPRIILIAGPSSSGKTTFSKRLGIQLRVNGFSTANVSLDDYFVDRVKSPRDKNGDYDFESLHCIDVPLFNKHLKRLLLGEVVEIPRFDFRTGFRKKEGVPLFLDESKVLIIEGIHCLNPKLTREISVDDKFRIFVSALTQLNLHDHDRIPTSDTRIIRRIVRDSTFRGYSAAETILRWPSVRSGEHKNIFPSQEDADVVFNSALFYELAVLKRNAERELLRVEKNHPAYPEVRRLLKFLSYFLSLDLEFVPKTSILREFVGGSSFRYV